MVYIVFLRNSTRDSKKGWALEGHSIALTYKTFAFLESPFLQTTTTAKKAAETQQMMVRVLHHHDFYPE